MTAQVSVVIADDQALVRGGFRVLVDSAPDLEVVGEAETGQRAVELVEELRPDVVLMDIRMPVVDGLAAMRVISTMDVDTRVLVLTTFDLDEYIFGALRAGASGFLLKDTPPIDLLAGIRIVAQGDSLLSPSVTRHAPPRGIRASTDRRPPRHPGALEPHGAGDRGTHFGGPGMVQPGDR